MGEKRSRDFARPPHPAGVIHDHGDLPALAAELGRLWGAAAQQAKTAEQRVALGRIGAAERAARAGDGAGVGESLRAAGSWALGVAAWAGLPLAVDALRQALDLP